MKASIKQLKTNYKLLLAQRKSLPTYDRSISLPLSTGNPLFDSALTEKIVATYTMNESEHLSYAWNTVKSASVSESEILLKNADGILNDYKLLLSLHNWQENQLELSKGFIKKLPWGWRLAFPAFVISPANQIFTGWRKNEKFRLVSEPRYTELKDFYRELLSKASGVTILKYKNKIQESAALLKYKFMGDLEEAIHDICFDNGRKNIQLKELEPIGTYTRARNALNSNNLKSFISILEESPYEIPITSYMGLLGSNGYKLNNNSTPEVNRLRKYAIRSATAVESVLRLNEWSSWLNEGYVNEIAQKIQVAVVEKGIDIPFFKITKAFIHSPSPIKKMILKPIYVPLLKSFGVKMSGLLGNQNLCTFFMPGNMLHIMSFLLYSVIQSSTKSQLCLLYKDGVEKVSIDLENVLSHLTDDIKQFEAWLLSEFGGLVSYYNYSYDFKALGVELGKLNPENPIFIDLPFANDSSVLNALLPMEQVFNLNTVYGAPGELCIAYEYYKEYLFSSKNWFIGSWTRYSDTAAERAAEVLEKLRWFQKFVRGN